MTYFLYGEDTFRSKQKLHQIVRRYYEKNSWGLCDLDCSSVAPERVEEQLGVRTMFSEPRLVILRNPFDSKELAARLTENPALLKTPDGALVVVQEGAVDAKHPLFKVLVDEGRSQEFSRLEGAKLVSWVKKRFSELGAKADEQVVSRIAGKTKGDLWKASQEVAKCAAFSSRATLEDLAQLRVDEPGVGDFEVVNAIASRDKARAVDSVSRQLQLGDSPLAVLARISSQVRTIILVKDAKERSVRITNLHPFVVKKSEEASRRFSAEELYDLHGRLAKADKEAKTGGEAQESALFGALV